MFCCICYFYNIFSYLITILFQIKKDPKTGQSKGYGFIRFANYESQVRALSAKHKIDNRVVTVRIPISQVNDSFKLYSYLYLFIFFFQ